MTSENFMIIIANNCDNITTFCASVTNIRDNIVNKHDNIMNICGESQAHFE